MGIRLTQLSTGLKVGAELGNWKGIKKIWNGGLKELKRRKIQEMFESFEYNKHMFAFVRLMQLLHKFCACFLITI